MDRSAEIQEYIRNHIDTRWGHFSKVQMIKIAEHFGGRITSSGRYLLIDGEEYVIRRDIYGTRKVYKMDWGIK